MWPTSQIYKRCLQAGQHELQGAEANCGWCMGLAKKAGLAGHGLLVAITGDLQAGKLWPRSAPVPLQPVPVESGAAATPAAPGTPAAPLVQIASGG